MKHKLQILIKNYFFAAIVLVSMQLSAQSDCEKKLNNWNINRLPVGQLEAYEKCVITLEGSTKKIEGDIIKLQNEINVKKNQIRTLIKSYDELIKYYDENDKQREVDEYNKKKAALYIILKI